MQKKPLRVNDKGIIRVFHDHVLSTNTPSLKAPRKTLTTESGQPAPSLSSLKQSRSVPTPRYVSPSSVDLIFRRFILSNLTIDTVSIYTRRTFVVFELHVRGALLLSRTFFHCFCHVDTTAPSKNSCEKNRSSCSSGAQSVVRQ